MKKVSCIAIISFVIAMSGCAVDSMEDPEGFDDSLSEIESAGLGQCPPNAVCAWSGTYFSGQFSQWSAGSSSVCKTHAGNSVVRSGANNTGYWVRFGGQVTLPPYTAFYSGYTVYGRICWPV